MRIFLILILCSLSGFLYRLGGSGKANTKARDFGVPMCMVLTMCILGLKHWTLLFSFGLLFGALTTYFKEKDTDAQWYNWLVCGLAYSISMLPTVWALGLWPGFGLRTLTLGLGTMIWSQTIGNAVWEEAGRGALIIATLPMLLILK